MSSCGQNSCVFDHQERTPSSYHGKIEQEEKARIEKLRFPLMTLPVWSSIANAPAPQERESSISGYPQFVQGICLKFRNFLKRDQGNILI
jgi:hypothetical protein